MHKVVSTSSFIAHKEILKQVRRIEIRTRKLVNEIFSGQYSSVFKGQGMEFSQVREYQPGDDPRGIDWNVTARTGRLFIKEFLEERELTIMILLDASSSLFFGSRKNLKSEIAAELAALLSFSAIRNNDKVGLLIFTDQIEKFYPPRKGQRHILALIQEILCFRPKNSRTNLSVGLEFLGKVLKRRSVCFLMSDFLSPIDYLNPIRIVSKKHDLIAIRISDPLEKRFPVGGRFLLRDVESGKVNLVVLGERSRSIDMERNHFDFFSNWKRSLGKSGVDLIEVQTDEPYVQALLSFFSSRARRFR